jgi:small-conductance mechanosensitive channel
MSRYVLLVAVVAWLVVPRAAAGQDAPPADTASVTAPPAVLTYTNRSIVELRATTFARTPADRVAAARRVLDQLVEDGGIGSVTTRPLGSAMLVSIGGRDIFALVPGDVDPTTGDTPSQRAAEAASRLQLALNEADELRAPARLARSTALALLATAGLALLLIGLKRGREFVAARTTAAADRRLGQIRGGELMRASRMLDALRVGVGLATAVVGLLLAYSWLTFVLRRFPYTRPWGESLRAYLLERLGSMTLALVHAVPNLFSVLIIVVFTRIVARLVSVTFDAIEQRRIDVPGFYPETAQPTRRIITAFVWLFGIALAYPYLPGSNTDAFKGVSVFAGLMVSLGSSGIINQVMSGLTLTYSRALHAGDFVRIGEVEGTVLQLGALSTKLKTPRGEEITIPNAVVVATITTNYSRHEGVVMPTSITIGYDVAWRQVEALLLRAAERTPGLRRDPRPRVLQTALHDHCVEYTLLVSPEQPHRRAAARHDLHANIQDAFNEFGVQIMSPRYEADPDTPKIVPRARWFEAPARADPTEERVDAI